MIPGEPFGIVYKGQRGLLLSLYDSLFIYLNFILPGIFPLRFKGSPKHTFMTKQTYMTKTNRLKTNGKSKKQIYQWSMARRVDSVVS